MEEIEKYRGIYADESGRFATYGHTNHGAGALRIIERDDIRSVIDLGCGWNEFAKDLRARGRIAIGSDFACPGADRRDDVAAGPLPFPPKNFECVTAFDMLEHLRPDQVEAALAEMARLAHRFIVSISHVDSKNRWQGHTLHPTVQSEAWWIAALTRAGAAGIRKEGHYLTGRWESRLTLPKFTRVCLVGNGPGLLAREMGEAIDAHDFVVRFNNYKIAGFERHTGTRIDLWSTIASHLENESACPRVLTIHENSGALEGATEVYRLPRPFYDRARRLVQDRLWVRGGLRTDPCHLLASSGLMVALWFLDLVGVDRVTLAGYDHFQKGKGSDWHHYWLPRNTKPPGEHDGVIEAAIFQELVDAGRVMYLS